MEDDILVITNDILIVTDVDFIMKYAEQLQFESTNKVKLVRDYLENECGFKHTNWKTEEYEELNWLDIIEFDNSVHGNQEPHSTKIKCNIDYLIGISISDIEMCKPINLKE